MLALPSKRQHFSQAHPTSTLSSLPNHHSPSSSQQLSFDALSQQLSAQQLFDQKLLHDYLESQHQSFATSVIVDAESNPFMSGAYDLSNPAIRIQQSTPTPQVATSSFSQSPMLSSSAATAGLENWGSFRNTHGAHSLQTPRTIRSSHQRAPSSSSTGSNGSQYQAAIPTSTYSVFSNHLPTPTHTPTQDSFLNATNNTNFNFTSNAPGMDSTMAAHLSMKHALMDQHVPDEDVPGFVHSARHSVSSYGHDSPATPHTAHGEDFDERFKMPPTGEIPSSKVDAWFDLYLTYGDEPDMRQHTVPKFERTYTDAAVDTFYDPTVMLAQTQSIQHPKTSSLLSPYRGSNHNDIVQRTLQAAQNARSQSPSSSASRGVSPFRHNSPFRQPSNSFNSPRMRVGTAAEAREQKVEADAAYAMKSIPSNDEAQPKTISPKDALLDYREADEDSKAPLFPDGGASEYDQYNGGNQYRNATQSSYDTTSGQSYRRDSWATPQFSPNFSTTSVGSSQPSSFAFVPPSISGNIHGLSYGTAQSHYRSTPSNMPSATDNTPDFPAHLTSMESSASEAGPEPSSQLSDHQLQKPASSSADSGTYTCTYHGCAQRFETPQKLQKHKREGHRNANAAVGMTSAALLERNSQAGPHKCERINPTTGKPCNTIFSRPYDLTRHEDTIHNARKQKVRCALCVEEKTFSRNDALTRHMRVVHPEVDFPGKHRRRGGNHD
ncbi:hypothetical protein B0J11DRAFT_435118 [Dendryphion nanum]|uniref:C2H2-type domain-containing protein n=1 Tax=Dendryphion nanum TaxID=256645 RepID=A0A9P9IM08_9PLEO|nr:hypothetical protein B0J11DRAFT_435118 [Dendryphion nanum]